MVSPSILVVYGQHCRLENISQTGTWLTDEEFFVRGRHFVRRGESPRPGDEAAKSARALCRRCSPNLESASSRGRLRAVQVAARARESRSQPGPEPGRLFRSGMDPRQSPRSRLTAESPDRRRRRVYWTQPSDRHRVCQSGEGCPSQVV